MILRMGIRVLAFDGDDTLWHNEGRFRVTQTALRDLLHRHVPDVDVDSHLFEVEMRNLRLYGYGVKAFTLSMLETAIEKLRALREPEDTRAIDRLAAQGQQWDEPPDASA